MPSRTTFLSVEGDNTTVIGNQLTEVLKRTLSRECGPITRYMVDSRETGLQQRLSRVPTPGYSTKRVTRIQSQPSISQVRFLSPPSLTHPGAILRNCAAL